MLCPMSSGGKQAVADVLAKSPHMTLDSTIESEFAWLAQERCRVINSRLANTQDESNRHQLPVRSQAQA
jgi:hypothetical protein